MKRVLVVDDEVAFLIPLKRLLSGPGLDVCTCETYEEAMMRLQESAIDAVIADIRLVGATTAEGLSILKDVKGASPAAKVIIITGFGSPDVMRQAYALGADYYFEKPVAASVLEKALADMGISK